MKRVVLNSLIAVILFLMPKVNFGQAPDLGAASSFSLFTAVGAFTNNGLTAVTGDIGTNAGTFLGFPPGTVLGDIHVEDAISLQAAAAVNAAYGYLSTLDGPVLGVLLGNGQTLTPGIYNTGGASSLAGDLTFDGEGNPDAIFIIRIGGALEASTFSNVFLINGASLYNIYWQIDGAFTLGDYSVFRGTIVGNGSIELLEGSSLLGRGLTRAGAITLHHNIAAIEVSPTAGFSANVTTGCAPFTVQFSNESSENATSFEWDFPGGNPNSSTAENPLVTYDSTGTYSVTLTVSNGAGNNSFTQIDYITVTTVPVAGFTTLVNNATVEFTNTSVNAMTYVWDFGDNTTSTDTDPIHTYANDSTYTVTLTATNECGSITTTQVVAVITPPTAGFSVNNTQGCAPFTVQFSNESSENTTSWQWEFIGGTPATSTDENPVVVYNSAGTYSVTLTVSNAAGSGTVTVSDFIVVTTVPTPGFMVSINVFEVTFTNTTINATSYVWDFGDNTTGTDTDPIHTYANDGTYTVTLTATNECGSITTTQVVIVVTPPTAGFSANATTGCAPFVVQFSNESSENTTSWQWEFAGGTPATSTDENPVVVYNSAGTYAVTLTVSNAAGSGTVTVSDFIVVTIVPTPGFTVSINVFDVTFTNTTINATSYVWDFGDSQTSTEENPVHTYTEDGIYLVTLTATNDCGSVTTSQNIVVAFQVPVAFFTAENTNGCVPLEVTFQNMSSENTTFFHWEFPGGAPSISADENPTVLYSVPGTYDVTLTAGNLNGSDMYTQTAYIVVNTVPEAAWTYDQNLGTVTFANTSANATSYEWDFGDSQTSTEENPVHVYQSLGEFEVTLTALNECGFASNTQAIIVNLTSVEEIPGIEEFNIFPNPNSGLFTLTLKGQPYTSLQVNFTNIFGQQILTGKVDFHSGQLVKEFAFAQLPAGTYVFSVKSGETVLYRRVVIE